MRLHELRPSKGSTQKKKRLARGTGSGRGRTATRGSKGQRKRNSIWPGFEGGQTPIHRRLPVKKGFRNVNHKEFAVVNVGELEEAFEAGAEVTLEALREKGLIGSTKKLYGVKVLGEGELKKSFTVKAQAFSKTAVAAIEKAGGKAETVDPEPKARKKSAAKAEAEAK